MSEDTKDKALEDDHSVDDQDQDADKSGESDSDKSGDNDKSGDKSKEEKDDLAPIKEKLDKAYSERDSLAKELKDAKEKIRQQEIDHLKEQGKELEALQKQIKQKDERIEELETEVTSLTRDVTVRDRFHGINFRNDRASALAYESVVKELVQDDKGKWVHKSGKSIEDFVKSFIEDEDNQFLFAPKTNRGTGTGSKTSASSSSDDDKTKDRSGGTSIFDRSQADVLKDVKAGKIKIGQPK